VSEIDPIEYGRLIQAVEELQRKVNGMDDDLKKLVSLADKSKGGLWIGMTIASIAGGFLAFVGNLLFSR
jgi:hypothetical protein